VGGVEGALAEDRTHPIEFSFVVVVRLGMDVVAPVLERVQVLQFGLWGGVVFGWVCEEMVQLFV